MTAALTTAPVALLDVEDLADVDFDALLADCLDMADVPLRADGAGADAAHVGRLVEAPGSRPGPADAVALAWAIRRERAEALGVHALGLKAALLAG